MNDGALPKRQSQTSLHLLLGLVFVVFVLIVWQWMVMQGLQRECNREYAVIAKKEGDTAMDLREMSAEIQTLRAEKERTPTDADSVLRFITETAQREGVVLQKSTAQEPEPVSDLIQENKVVYNVANVSKSKLLAMLLSLEEKKKGLTVTQLDLKQFIGDTDEAQFASFTVQWYSPREGK